MDYVKPFVIGGSIIAGTKYVSTFISPALAPIIGGMPTGIIASFFLSKQNEKREFFSGYVYTSFLLFLTILFIHLMSIHTKLNVDAISSIALVVWAILSYFTVHHFIK
jgi:hypothetical protein